MKTQAQIDAEMAVWLAGYLTDTNFPAGHLSTMPMGRDWPQTNEALRVYREWKRGEREFAQKRRDLEFRRATGIVAHGCRYFSEDGDSGESWFLWKGEVSREEVAERLSSQGLCTEGDWTSPHDCSGQLLVAAVVVESTKTRTLAKQYWSYDV